MFPGFSPCVDQVVVANSGDQVYFEQEILALLLIHQADNLLL